MSALVLDEHALELFRYMKPPALDARDYAEIRPSDGRHTCEWIDIGASRFEPFSIVRCRLDPIVRMRWTHVVDRGDHIRGGWVYRCAEHLRGDA